MLGRLSLSMCLLWPKARLPTLIGALPSLASEEGAREQGHDSSCDGGFEGDTEPADLAGAAELKASFSSRC